MKHRTLIAGCLLVLSASCLAEPVTFLREYTYQASELDSKVSSRTVALEQVKKLMLEELGTYLQSETVVVNNRLTKNQIQTYSAGAVSTEIVTENWDGKSYYLKAKLVADPKEIAASIKKLIEDSSKRKELDEANVQYEKLKAENEKLIKDYEQLKAKLANQSTPAPQPEQYNKNVSKLNAISLFEKGLASGLAGNYFSAIESFSKAIELNPEYYQAYYNRGYAYSLVKKNAEAIADYDKAIEINSKYAAAYIARGNLYFEMGNPQEAIRNMNIADNAISPDDLEKKGLIYRNLGIVYYSTKNDNGALEAFTKAIAATPNDSRNFYSRAFVYARLGDTKSTMKDLETSANMGNEEAQAKLKFMRDRGW